jgi:type IV pilus assembly protein PilE
MYKKIPRGFSLLELSIAILIVGLLIRLALPSYRDYVQRGWRSEARVVLLSNAQFMARHYAENFSFRASDVAPSLPLPTSPDGSLSPTYQITLSTPDNNSFTLSATPWGWTDTTCGSLTLNHLGYRSATAAVNAQAINQCWQR